MRLAALGLGWWGSLLAEAVARDGSAEIVSCWARRPESRQEFATRHGCRAQPTLEAVLADPTVEGVLIATAHDSHRSLVEAAAAAGKHVFAEKPLANTLADARACVEAAASAGVLLQVGHQRRRQPANRRIKEMITSGDLGEVLTITTHQSTPYGYTLAEDAWRWDPDQSPLGSMTSMGVHPIDTIQYLAGPIARVTGLTRPGRSHPVDESTVLAFELASGALATLATSFFTPAINEVAVFGTGGAAYNQRDGSLLSVQMRSDEHPRLVEVGSIDLIADELHEFAAAIRGQATVEVDGAAGMSVVAVMEAAIEAVATGRTVEVATG